MLSGIRSTGAPRGIPAEGDAAKEARGNTGDPWAPIHLAEHKSFTLGDRDWTHEVLVTGPGQARDAQILFPQRASDLELEREKDIIAADDDLLGRYLPQVASGEAMFSYALSEREAGSDAASMKTRAVADGDAWVLNGQKSWISNAGESTYYTVMAVTDPSAGPRGISAFVIHADDEGFSLGTPERKLGIHGSPTREILFDNCWIPADRIIGELRDTE